MRFKVSATSESSSPLFCLWSIFSLIFPVARAQNLTTDLLDLVAENLAVSAIHSWELGTRSQALVNFNISLYSVFDQPTLPPSGALANLSLTNSESALSSSALSTFNALLNITTTVINLRPTQNPPNDSQPLFANDTSAGDPCSMGFAALLANWTGATGADFAGAARQQLNWMFSDNVPKTDKGAFSHRQSEVQLWSDSVYMVPPFLAYYGLVTHNRSLLMEAHNQIQLYREILRDGNKTTAGLWFHIALGNVTGQDYGHWSTGNAWAAFGMSRVYASMKQSQFANTLKGEMNDLGKWIDEIFNAMYSRADQETGLFRSYVDSVPGYVVNGGFLDGSSSALMAAAVYRNAVLRNQVHNIPHAEKVRKTLSMLGVPRDTAPTTTSSSSVLNSTHTATVSHSLSLSSSLSSSSVSPSTNVTHSSSSPSSTDAHSSSSPSSTNATHSSTNATHTSTSHSTSSPISSSSIHSSDIHSSSTHHSESGTSTAPPSASVTSLIPSIPSTLSTSTSTSTALAPSGSFVHFPNGWLDPVVDPLNWRSQGSHSPEGQAFVLEMQSAYLAWVQKGSFGINGALGGKRAPSLLGSLSLSAGWVAVGYWLLY